MDFRIQFQYKIAYYRIDHTRCPGPRMFVFAPPISRLAYAFLGAPALFIRSLFAWTFSISRPGLGCILSTSVPVRCLARLTHSRSSATYGVASVGDFTYQASMQYLSARFQAPVIQVIYSSSAQMRALPLWPPESRYTQIPTDYRRTL